jgi:hypothetical protein
MASPRGEQEDSGAKRDARSDRIIPIVWHNSIVAGEKDVEISFPDLFLVGAPRCGTTALMNWLKTNPQICFSKPKEPHYFTKIEKLLPRPDVRTHYLEPHFWHYDPAQHLRLAEGSVSTLYSPEAVARILSLNPAAKFVVVVRNPLEMLPSFHALLLYYLEEDVEDFEQAWRLQEARAAGLSIPSRCMDPQLLQYAEMGRLGKHVDALFQVAGRERCLPIAYDDLVADPRGTYGTVVSFLGLEDHEPDLRRRNESRAYRLGWLHRLIYRPPVVKPDQFVRFVAGRTRKGGVGFLKRTRKRLLRWNTVSRRPAELSPALRDELRATFAEDIERLGKLLDRDLAGWR